MFVYDGGQRSVSFRGKKRTVQVMTPIDVFGPVDSVLVGPGDLSAAPGAVLLSGHGVVQQEMLVVPRR